MDAVITPRVMGCERPCTCRNPAHRTKLIVLTGGPGAGKTAALEYMRKVLCEHVAILPEAASVVFGGGFWRLASSSAAQAAQRAIFHVQRESENLVLGEKKWAIGLCDRGTLDGIAYWPGSETEFLHAVGVSLDHEFARYAAVIHLQSPASDHGYNHENPIRIESAEEAAAIDARIHNAWRRHPRYERIASTDDFATKLTAVVVRVQALMPECCKAHFVAEKLSR